MATWGIPVVLEMFSILAVTMDTWTYTNDESPSFYVVSNEGNIAFFWQYHFIHVHNTQIQIYTHSQGVKKETLQSIDVHPIISIILIPNTLSNKCTNVFKGFVA